MPVVPIIKVPNKLLTTKCEEVKTMGKAEKKLVQNLLDTLHAAKNPEGAGLAAPQIGVLKRICIVRKFLPDKGDEKSVESVDFVLVNPVITRFSTEKYTAYEGCLSIPDTYVQVERSKKIKLTAQDVDGKRININASGFFARVIQHEVDHLNGILMTQKAIGKPLTEKELDELYAKS